MRLLYLAFLVFVFLFLLQIFTGIYLYTEKYGFNYLSVTEYILGNKEKFIQSKTLYGLLKLNFPHFFAMFLGIFITAHFLYFFKVKTTYFFIAGLSFLFAFLDILAPFLILKVSPLFAYLKIVSFLGFEISLFLIILILFYNATVKLKNHTTENH